MCIGYSCYQKGKMLQTHYYILIIFESFEKRFRFTAPIISHAVH